MVVFARFEVPFPPRRPRFGAGAEGVKLSAAETGVAAPDALALASSKLPSPVGRIISTLLLIVYRHRE